MKLSLAYILFFALFHVTNIIKTPAQNMSTNEIKKIEIARSSKDFDISNVEHISWERANPTVIDSYWNGNKANNERTFIAKLLYTNKFLYVRFQAIATDEIVLNSKPDINQKTIGLWERDVFEIFIAPQPELTTHYFEFEIAPTGEWLDLEIRIDGSKRLTKWEYKSEMQSYVKFDQKQIIAIIKVPWERLGVIPKQGNYILGNIFRCTGSGSNRGYLAWSPTFTATPNFHVPDKFGKFIFK
jgi:alpha-galactosidase